ncbi:MAG: hypothetical protein ABIH50_03880 [bacterium]
MSKFCSACLLLMFVLSFQVNALRDDITVDIKADKLRFIEDTGQIEAAGSVQVTIEGVMIMADSLKMDQATNIATAEGNVRLINQEYDASGQTLVYNTNNQEADFADFGAELSPATVKGKVYVTAKKLSDKKKQLTGGPGTVTTCEKNQPHYYLLADKIAFFPKDKVEGWNVTIYEGVIPVLWLPYLFYDLKGQQKQNWTFGHNDVEGDYLKSSWALPMGLVLLDYMSKKGWGYGIQRGYGLGKYGNGELTLYYVDEKDTGLADWVEKIKHEKKLNQWTTLKLKQEYISTYRLPGGRIDQTELGLNLSYANKGNWGLDLNSFDDRASQYQKFALGFNQASGSESLSYNYNYEFGKAAPQWLRKSQRFTFRTPLISDRLTFSTATNYNHNSTGPGDPGEEKIEPQIEFAGREQNFSWRYYQNWFIDLRQNLSPGIPRYEFLEKQPEIEIFPQALDLNYFRLSPSFGVGTYREVKSVPLLTNYRDFTASRFKTTLNADKAITLGLSTLTLGAGIDQFLYTPGDQLYALRESAGLFTNVSPCIRNEINFRHGYTSGNTPFFFDQLGTRYHDISEKLTFYFQNQFNWSFDSGYNWQTYKWYDVMTHLRAAPNEKLSYGLDTGWDIENRQYKDLISSARFAPASCFALTLAFNQNMNLGQLNSASALYDIYLLEGAVNQLYLRISQSYDPVSRQFKVRDIMMTKDLHCFEMRLAYSDYTKNMSVTFSLKAIPGEPVSFDSSRGFSYDGIERGLQQINPAGQVTRH